MNTRKKPQTMLDESPQDCLHDACCNCVITRAVTHVLYTVHHIGITGLAYANDHTILWSERERKNK